MQSGGTQRPCGGDVTTCYCKASYLHTVTHFSSHLYPRAASELSRVRLREAHYQVRECAQKRGPWEEPQGRGHLLLSSVGCGQFCTGLCPPSCPSVSPEQAEVSGATNRMVLAYGEEAELLPLQSPDLANRLKEELPFDV